MLHKQGYLDDAAFENGHAILAEKIARDQVMTVAVPACADLQLR
jgi:hypothetical protein